jgi:hypothetical protein
MQTNHSLSDKLENHVLFLSDKSTSPKIPPHLNKITKDKNYIPHKTDLTTKLSLFKAQKEQKTASKTKLEDENNFLHRGESVAAYLFYCSRAKV